MTTFPEADVQCLLTAVHFAAEKHRHQRRKDHDRSPYINHPIDVAMTLWKVAGVRDTATLIAAILHDTLEDTATTPEELRELFGPEVLALLQEVTDDKRLPKEERKRLQVVHAAGKSRGAKLIKLADKIHNVHDVGHAPPPDWSLQRRVEYLDWTERVVAGLRGTNAPLEALYGETLREARELLQGPRPS